MAEDICQRTVNKVCSSNYKEISTHNLVSNYEGGGVLWSCLTKMNADVTQKVPVVYEDNTNYISESTSNSNQEEDPAKSVSQNSCLSVHQPSSLQQQLSQWEALGTKFQDYKQSCPFLTIPQQRERLYSLLPLFHQVCDKTAGVLSVPFIGLLASDLGNLLAIEVRKRIYNKPAGPARLSLSDFLQGKEEGMSGYLLLKSVYLLSKTDQKVLCCLIKTGLPEVFLQSLYLFLAFPLGQGVTPVLQEFDSLVQDIFIKTMLNLCSQAQGVEDLTKSSDFEYLLKAAASGWDCCDIRWSVAVERLLIKVSKALAPGLLHYLQTLRCIPSFLQTLSQRMNALEPNVLCQVTVILLSFLSHSYAFSPSLLRDFDNNQGYPILLKILLRCEGDAIISEGGEEYLKELLSLLASLVICGNSEVKVSGQISHPQLPSFSKAHGASSGQTVKNLQAFQVLQSAFQSSIDAHLCGKILSTMQYLWSLDHSNFFLLEWSLQPISQFVEILPQKPLSVQAQFFQLLHFVVCELSYIPHQTLQKVQELIKQNQNPSCTLEALKLLQNITPIDSLFSDLFRDSGLLGILLTQLRNRAKILRRAAVSSNANPEVDYERELTIGRLQTVDVLLQSSVRNVVIIKDYGMVPYIKVFLDDMGCRQRALYILEHLSAVDPDEYMSTIIGSLCSSTQSEITLKLDLLQSLQQVLKSGRERYSFRNAAGFDVLLSLLSDMEGSLSETPVGCWSGVQPNHILLLIRSIMMVISAALCQDIANQHFVKTQQVFQRLAEDLKRLGCFRPSLTECASRLATPNRTRNLCELLRLALNTHIACPESLRNCFVILSLLLGMATGTLCQCGNEHNTKPIISELPMKQDHYQSHCASNDKLCDLMQDLFPEGSNRCPMDDLVTVEPGALCAIVTLIQSAYSEKTPELSKEFQCAVVEHIQALVQSERQRQVLCESLLLSCIVTFCRTTLVDYQDPLRLPLVRLFEKLASQSVQPDVLRQFLCCAVTMKQSPEDYADDTQNRPSHSPSNGSILHTCISLVSMASPRRFQTNTTSVMPSFVEFDMSTRGYGFLFLPTVATIKGSNVEEILCGGVGTDGRSFPPQGGLTFTCWFLVSKFSLAPEPHPLRFLTIARHMSGKQQHHICLSIAMNAVEDILVISTEEQEFQPLDIMEVEPSPIPSHAPSQIVLKLSGCIVVEQWHHLSVVLKEVKRSSIVSAWIDGQLLGSGEMRYIQRLPGGSSSLHPTSLVDIHAFLGTPKMWRQKSSLLWRLGFFALFEEALSEEMLLLIQRLGPAYCGNFKNVYPLLSEEKIVFGVNILSSYVSTVAQIKDTYNEVDGRHIAKELGISSRDSCTPVFVARNLASHLLGAMRTLGAVTIEGIGVRFFHSSSAADALNYIGGPVVILSLVSMATDDQALYASLKALVSVLSSSPLAEQLMEHIDGYRLLGFLLRQKSHLLNQRIFQLLLNIAGTADFGVGPSRPMNLDAVKYILCNFQLWLESPGDLDLALLAHLEDLLKCQRYIQITQHVPLIDRLIFLLNDPRMTHTKIHLVCSLLSYSLISSFSRKNFLRLGLLLVSTLPLPSVDESKLLPQDPSLSDTSNDLWRKVWLRNQLLGVLIELMCPSFSCLSLEQQEEVLITLGTDWFLLFVRPSIHASSVALGMRLIAHFLQIQGLLTRFKERARAGAYVENSTYDMHIQMVGNCTNKGLEEKSKGRQVVPLNLFLSECLAPLSSASGDLDAKLQTVFQNHNPEKILQDGLCTEAALLLLIMMKALVCQYSVAEEKNQDPVKAKQHQHCQSVRKAIQELMYHILHDSLNTIPILKQDHLFEYLLETQLTDGSSECGNRFQTEILQCGMEIFCSISQRGENQYSELLGTSDFPSGPAIANLSYFSQKLLEKMHWGVFMADPCEILIFFVKQITAVTHTAAPCNRDSLFSMLYGYLNRSILYCLSRPRHTASELLSLLKVLQLLFSRWDDIFTTYNSSPSFTACLIHCLLQIYTGSHPQGFGVKTKPRRHSWQMIFLSEEEEQITECPPLQEVHTQVLQAIQTVWMQLIVHRRQVLEEHYKVDLSTKQGEIQITQVTPMWEEMASKCWQQYLVSEKKNLKIKRRTSTVLENKAVHGLHEMKEQMTDLKLKDAATTMNDCMRAGQDVFKYLYRDNQQVNKCEHMATYRNWVAQEEHLYSEGGVWGSLSSQYNMTWELSPHEGPWRVRKRMQPVWRMPQTLKYTESRGIRSLQRMTSPGGWMSDRTGLTFFPALQEDLEGSSSRDLCMETLRILQEFSEGEKISFKMSVVFVEGHVILEGVLLFGKKHFYLCPHFILSSSGEVTCTSHGVSSIQDPFIYDLCYKDKPSTYTKKLVGNLEASEIALSLGREAEPVTPWAERFSYHEVMDLQPRHFLMQEIAMEIFFMNRTTTFLVFPNGDLTAAMKWFQSLIPSLKQKDVVEDIQDIRTSSEKVMLQRWQKREVGNFEYLMFLNNLAGRTIRDLMQYPVLPWVLQDYKSEALHLFDPKVFRDLAKPMGAQSKERSQKFIHRYQEVEKNNGDLEGQCHYCTHYSSASIVSSYLVRVEPFTQAMRCLQGGSLDVADRLFHSVSDAWESASSKNMSDVRELIPEFYYLPEMFTNSKNCELGCMQDGTVVGDVILPPWAHGDPHSFVRLHREALESEYVSSQLHHWIDLIFGYKQRGDNAVQALNLFHPYFYGSPANMRSADHLIRNTVTGFIINFGQVPKQLFTKSHPVRLAKDSTGHQIIPFYTIPGGLKPTKVSPRGGNLRGAVGQIIATRKGVFAVEKNHVLLPPTCTSSISWGHSDGSVKLHSCSTHKVLAVWELILQWGWCHCIVCPLPTLIVTAMSSSVLCAWEFSSPGLKDQEPRLKIKKVLTGHSSAVLCVSASMQYGVLISGSSDGSCIIWDLDKLKCFRRLPTHQGKVTCVNISDSTGYIATYSISALYLWSVNGDPVSCTNIGSGIHCVCFAGLSVMVTGSVDGTVKLWKMEVAEENKEIGLGGEKLGTSLRLFHQLVPGDSTTGKQHRLAAVTALTVSRNSEKLFVGDERGIITSWHLD
ncbi:WD repeat- and FYVE domain-containing protein 4 [Spea bombifrons]|uniref:WD repeat- and FYVE domain-containing protein 4 n=1 Tax=Spea bombifrons TaxID=233779 RepID=UPI00234A1397|nr:WD repeat- and FYVE domain-containing protein 4 [Spea bombifrons]